ncbi:MAG: signal peptidase I [Candidatus Berkelbacteria bacterium Licking1014_7]|uniref:Signal peptidase I n=1 Tax=Candidatus Berkelbacteria bacterium Licking1014_7 TaxID=2017147 RepID=A0A554LKS0_9BACT|nr:MAG: signal peptidase I [Candidatus Berkelbacteria bacterium Licking1014_7]
MTKSNDRSKSKWMRINLTISQIINFAIEIVKTAAIMLIIAFAIKNFLIQTFVIEGVSMEPNFHDNEYLLVDKISYRFSAPKRGDVIVFNPTDSPDSYIKRIIGLPGETVKIVNNKIYVDGYKLDEPYLPDAINTNTSSQSLESKIYVLQDNEYFVIGDNRQNSKDSRVIGAVNFSQFEGRVFVIFYPFNHLRLI